MAFVRTGLRRFTEHQGEVEMRRLSDWLSEYLQQ